jgi:hypothetical protein
MGRVQRRVFSWRCGAGGSDLGLEAPAQLTVGERGSALPCQFGQRRQRGRLLAVRNRALPVRGRQPALRLLLAEEWLVPELLEFLSEAGSPARQLAGCLVEVAVPAWLGERRFRVDLRFALRAWAQAQQIMPPRLLS